MPCWDPASESARHTTRPFRSCAGRCVCWFFFFKAEDGIGDIGVTGVQTCASSDLSLVVPAVTTTLLPIQSFRDLNGKSVVVTAGTTNEQAMRRLSEKFGIKINLVVAKDHEEIGRASCRERV